jgi:hypothetical protein
MLNIKILGPHNPNCDGLETEAHVALDDLYPVVPYQLEHVTDPDIIAQYHASLPALVINEQVVCSGHLPTHEEIMLWARQADCVDEDCF